MSLEITVSWRFVPSGFGSDPDGSYMYSQPVATPYEAAAAPREVDRVLPLGSSVVAPGLGLIIPA